MGSLSFRLLSIPLVVVILDQLTKWAAVTHLSFEREFPVMPFVSFVLAYNRGAAFGFLHSAGGWQNLFFIVVAILACGIILYMLTRPAGQDRQVAVGLSLILGGAIGNVIDRVAYGYVVDFIKLYYESWYWPIFNIADSAISIGAVLLILDALGISWAKRRTAA
jgi:signal peptidase II